MIREVIDIHVRATGRVFADRSATVRVTWSNVNGRPAFDMKAIREAAAQAGIDLSQFENVGDPADRLTISIPAPASAAA
jgi:hypothetical protein